MERVPWYIDGIPVNGIEGQPTYARGEQETLEVLITDEFEHEPWTVGGVWGGEDGTLWGETLGGTWGDEDLVGRVTRYTRLREYLEYAGEGSSYQLIGGSAAVHENPLDEWPVDSHIVPIEPGENIWYNPGMWALITGGSDETTNVSKDSVFRLNFEITMLAKLHEYEDREELLDDLSPVVVQYE
ncbi:hypothetical protein [Halostagnicola sp. A-GB9-2]|uniref:hypothetical protein n=1 Tax=Halostagnicola sp. A-GB9-2 TaxID=3048066 RepID=UPI0024C05B95|nr:hypothetical protein [Halostagnicola sp. A-GB9-2]MDJ1434770.1 hypothetical protein [Halostagnicola sp. A-GB9-2]